MSLYLYEDSPRRGDRSLSSRSDRDATARGAARSEFVADGAWRLAEGIRETVLSDIREAVEAEYADRLATAGPIRRLWIRWELNCGLSAVLNERLLGKCLLMTRCTERSNAANIGGPPSPSIRAGDADQDAGAAPQVLGENGKFRAMEAFAA